MAKIYKYTVLIPVELFVDDDKFPDKEHSKKIKELVKDLAEMTFSKSSGWCGYTKKRVASKNIEVHPK